MERIKTKSFDLAVYKRGDENAGKLVLVLPGRLDTKDYPHMRSHVDFLSERGYFAVSFDPPGSWETGDDIENYTMTNYIKAIHEIIEYYSNRPTVLVGHSRGGTVAMIAGVDNTAVTHLAIVMSNLTPSKKGEGKQKEGVEITKRDTPPNDTKNQTVFNLPMHYFADAMQYDPLPGLLTYNKPKLFIKGIQDDVVDYGKMESMFAELPEPKMYREIDSDHDYRRNPEAIKAIEGIIGDFLDQYEI